LTKKEVKLIQKKPKIYIVIFILNYHDKHLILFEKTCCSFKEMCQKVINQKFPLKYDQNCELGLEMPGFS